MFTFGSTEIPNAMALMENTLILLHLSSMIFSHLDFYPKDHDFQPISASSSALAIPLLN
jgi:hypothetical protein